jgi:hypothetical protein
MSSPVLGSLYSTKLSWLSSASSSMRTPVRRSTSVAAQAQKARCSSRPRSLRLPVEGIFGPDLARRAVPGHRSAKGLSSRAEHLAGLGARRCGQALSSHSGGPLDMSEEGREDRQPLTGPLAHTRLAVRPGFSLWCDLGPRDRAGVGPRAPPGGALHCPFDEVEVKGTHGHEVVDRVHTGYERVSDASGARRREDMPGWCSSRSRQKSRPKV